MVRAMPTSGWERALRFPLTRGLIAVCMVLGPALLIQWPVAKFHLEHSVWFLVAGIAMAAVVIVMYRIFVRAIEHRAPDELGPPRIGTEVIAGMVIGALLFTFTIGILRALGRYEVLGVNRASVLFYPLAGSIVSSVLEEVLFRGILFRLVEERLGSAIALAVSAVLFGTAHLANPGASALGAASIVIEAGILLAGAYLMTRRLWLPIGLHFAWNFMEAGVFGVEVSGRDVPGLLRGHLTGPVWLTGGKFGPEASVLAVGICLATGIEFIVLARRRGHWLPPFWARRPAPAAAPVGSSHGG